MQFVRHGPDIPERLLQKHEDGCVVFFCGAGISCSAGLPGFSDLANKLYQALSVTPNPVQQSAIKAGQFDTAIGLLEADVVNGRETVRRSLTTILTPDRTVRNATATHEALLMLAQNRQGRTQLITTNFDLLFEKVRAEKSLSFPAFEAPLLPVPKTRWDGLVYLHGRLPKNDMPTADDLDRLVLSSGDFGRAYLTECWAARFVSELFRNFTVCFVGYSINDPVLRYIVDALAADRLLGESPPEMFAFGSYSKGKEKDRDNEWQAKNITPILYREHQRHAYLHQTLRVWAGTYRDGVRGKERIVVECAIACPLASTKQDDFVGRMLWALSDPGGLPAKRFAAHDPAPSLDWLEPLSQKFDEFNDEVHRHLAKWLVSHYLDEQKLLLWLIKRQGGPFRDELIRQSEECLNDPAKSGNDGKTGPRPAMRTLWRLLLSGRVKSNIPESRKSIFSWHEQFKRDGLTTSVRLALRDILAPRVLLREPLPRSGEDNKGDRDVKLKCIKDIVDWEIVLASDHVHSGLCDLSKDERLPELLDDFSGLLRDALDLMRTLGDGKYSYIHQPSISDHSQNTDFHDWTALIELARDAWLATAAKSPERARIVAETWAREPYPVFRRLALFAAVQERIIPLRQALDWLLADERRWLWSEETRREAMRLLVSLAPQLDAAMLAELEQAILSGPPRDPYLSNIEPEHRIWLRLAKINETGAVLGAAGKERLQALSAQNPEWTLAANQRDEFPYWTNGDDEWRPFVATPRRRRDLVEWLRQRPSRDPRQKDDWQQRCRNGFATTACALCALAKEGVWPTDYWREALQVWSEEKLIKRSWRCMAPVVVGAPDGVLKFVGGWLQAVAKTFEGHKDHFLALAQRILRLDFEDDGNAGDSVFRAINHPVGHVTQALLDWWYRQEPDDGQGLPESIKPIFTELCNTQIAKFRHGRVLLAAHALSLFRVDSDWSKQHLLPLLDWNRSEAEAQAAWGGFLWSPRLYRPLMEAIEPAFLDTVKHYAQLGEHNKRFAAFLTSAALDPVGITIEKMAAAIRALPPDGLRESAQALVQALEGAGDQRKNYWENRVLPFWEKIWPKSNNQASSASAESLARLCVAAGDEFPSATKAIGNWLRLIQYPDDAIRRLYEADLSGRFPETALSFLDAILNDQSSGLVRELRQCLEAIAQNIPSLRQDRRFMRLDEFARRLEK
ncbi:MAG: SIR2 family protein [Herbaspirillum sp.]